MELRHSGIKLQARKCLFVPPRELLPRHENVLVVKPTLEIQRRWNTPTISALYLSSRKMVKLHQQFSPISCSTLDGELFELHKISLMVAGLYVGCVSRRKQKKNQTLMSSPLGWEP